MIDIDPVMYEVLEFPMQEGVAGFFTMDILNILPEKSKKQWCSIYTMLFPGGVTVEISSVDALKTWKTALMVLKAEAMYDDDEEEEEEADDG